MSVVLDAQALVALTLDEPGAGEVESILRRGDVKVTAVNLAETIDVLGRVAKLDGARIRATFVPLLETAIGTVEVDQAMAWQAADLRRRHYHARRSPLSLADCVCLAAAARESAIATADGALARAGRAEKIEVIALRDASGKRP